jgi:UDP-N-acetylglucosamine--N-acetylmuramyl-(pentapeptide) pyrophosphoryl-undecaprenol N-acetylglucosamine transferase
MPLWMAAADVVISRAGAMTLSELALMNKASILIPSPNVTDNHQYKNAKVLADAGAALLIEEKEMVDEHFSAVVLETLNDKNKMNSLRHNISKFADAEVNYRIFEEIKKLVLDNKS